MFESLFLLSRRVCYLRRVADFGQAASSFVFFKHFQFAATYEREVVLFLGGGALLFSWEGARYLWDFTIQTF